MARIECKNIHKSFGSIIALKGVSIEVEPGEVRALFGGNGSGKSTLAKIIGGFVKQTAGELLMNGQNVFFDSPAKAKRNHVIITAQELSLIPNLSVSQNLALCSMPIKSGMIDKKELRKMAVEALKQVHLEEAIDKQVGELSLNQKYMVEFAKALVQKPTILVLDEITSALYREEVSIVTELIQQLKKDGCCVIFVTHRMPEIYAICDTITVLRNGSEVGTYRVADKTKNELLSLMTGRSITDVDVVETEHNTRNRKIMLSAKNMKLLSKDISVDIDIHEGEIVGVAGLQGNGQSELVRALFATSKPITVELDGHLCRIKNPRSAVKKGIAFISGERELEGTFGNRSIMENVSAISDLVLNSKIGNSQKMDILQQYNIVMDSTKQQVQTLSGGNQQKVVMARWTAAAPKLILADDPTKGIDVNARRDVHNLLKSLVKNGSSVVFVSSDDEELVELTRAVPFSRIIVIYDGMIVNTLYGGDITTENIAAYAMPKEDRDYNE